MGLYHTVSEVFNVESFALEMWVRYHWRSL